MRLWYRVPYKLREAWYAIHPGILYGLQNVVAYLPTIWRDRDYDWTYMVRLWEKKFERVAQHEERYGNHTTSARDAKDLRVCAALCRRIRLGEYDDKEMDAHYDKWGHPTLERMFDGSGVMQPMSEKQGKEFMRIVNGGEQRLKNDLAFLCRIVQKRLRHWWN